MANEKVDPGALLVAVLVVGVTPMLEAGPWTPTNVLVAAVVLVVLFAFFWPVARPSMRIALATSVVVWFVAGVGLAYVVQQLFIWPRAEAEGRLVPIEGGGFMLHEADIDHASFGGLLAGIPIAIGTYLFLRRWHGSSLQADAKRLRQNFRGHVLSLRTRKGGGDE